MDALTALEEDILRTNMLRLVEHHKKYCEGEKCNICLVWVARVMDLAGIRLTDQQRGRFF